MSGILPALLALAVAAAAWSAIVRPSNSSRETAAGLESMAADRPQEAKAHFLEAGEWAGEEPVHSYNAGAAALVAREFEQGLRLNASVVERAGPLADDAAYNSGTALLRQQRVDDAIAHLRESLRHDPSNLDAKRNLELAERMRQQRQQNEGGGGESQQEQGGDEENQSSTGSEDGQQQDQQGQPEQGQVSAEEVLRAVAQQEAEELRRMRGARSEGQRRGSGW